MKIGVTVNGELLFHDLQIREAERAGVLAQWEKIHVAQLSHRVAAYVDGKWCIMTPVQAQLAGATQIVQFPPYDKNVDEKKFDSKKLKKVKPPLKYR